MIKNIYISLSFLLLTFCVKAQTLPVSGGTAAAHTLTIPGALTLVQGITVKYKANVACAAATTMDINSTGALNIKTTSGSNVNAGDIVVGQVVELIYDGFFWQMITPSANSTGNVTGFGTPNYLAKWGATQLGSSIVYDDGTNLGIGTSTPSSKLHLYGTADPLQIMVENAGGSFKTGYSKNYYHVLRAIGFVNKNYNLLFLIN